MPTIAKPKAKDNGLTPSPAEVVRAELRSALAAEPAPAPGKHHIPADLPLTLTITVNGTPFVGVLDWERQWNPDGTPSGKGPNYHAGGKITLPGAERPWQVGVNVTCCKPKA